VNVLLFSNVYDLVQLSITLECRSFFLSLQIVSISECHTCASTSKVLEKEATKGWLASRATKILRTNPTIGAKKLQVQLEQQFPIRVTYC
jgi:hypothetical protein